jgi:hypothetical protein
MSKSGTQKHAGGRPTKYGPEMLAKAQEYLARWKALGDVVPMLAGLCCHLEITKPTMQDWERDEDKPEFSAVCARVRVLQEQALINKGLSRESDASLSKLLLMKHGYSDRQEVDHRSEDGSMSPTRIEIVAPRITQKPTEG